jgi:hypothetical protein
MSNETKTEAPARVNPFGDLDDFQPKPKSSPKPVATDVIDRIANDHNFPSRGAKPSTRPQHNNETSLDRPRKKRVPKQTVQINIRVGVEDAKRFYAHVDNLKVDLNEFLTLLLDTFEASQNS